MPRVAVITPTYNRAHNGLLQKTMASVSGQTYRDLVHIVVDDGSTDDTPDVVSRLSRNDSRVVYARRERDHGQKFGASPASNYGINVLFSNPRFDSVRYVTFLHSDDLLTEESIERRIDEMENGYRFVCAPVVVCNEGMTPLYLVCPPDVANPRSLAKRLKIRTMKKVHPFPYHSVMVQKETLFRAGRFDENMGFGEDREFNVRLLEMLERGEASCINYAAVFKREHDDNVSALCRGNGMKDADMEYFARKHHKKWIDEQIELMTAFASRPHSYLPEPIKARLRPLRRKTSKEIPMDPFVAQIETGVAEQQEPVLAGIE